MTTNTHNRHGQGYDGGTNKMQYAASAGAHTWYVDPAVINPEELATFPKQVKSDGQHHEHERHHVTQRTPVRDGRNITRTDNHPEKNGFM